MTTTNRMQFVGMPLVLPIPDNATLLTPTLKTTSSSPDGYLELLPVTALMTNEN